jgi:hypothetical protein
LAAEKDEEEYGEEGDASENKYSKAKNNKKKTASTSRQPPHKKKPN